MLEPACIDRRRRGEGGSASTGPVSRHALRCSAARPVTMRTHGARPARVRSACASVGACASTSNACAPLRNGGRGVVRTMHQSGTFPLRHVRTLSASRPRPPAARRGRGARASVPAVAPAWTRAASTPSADAAAHRAARPAGASGRIGARRRAGRRAGDGPRLPAGLTRARTGAVAQGAMVPTSITCALGVPGNMSHGSLPDGFSEMPEVAAVAPGM